MQVNWIDRTTLGAMAIVFLLALVFVIEQAVRGFIEHLNLRDELLKKSVQHLLDETKPGSKDVQGREPSTRVNLAPNHARRPPEQNNRRGGED